VAGMKKPMTTQNRQKSSAKNIIKKYTFIIKYGTWPIKYSWNSYTTYRSLYYCEVQLVVNSNAK